MSRPSSTSRCPFRTPRPAISGDRRVENFGYSTGDPACRCEKRLPNNKLPPQEYVPAADVHNHAMTGSYGGYRKSMEMGDAVPKTRFDRTSPSTVKQANGMPEKNVGSPIDEDFKRDSQHSLGTELKSVVKKVDERIKASMKKCNKTEKSPPTVDLGGDYKIEPWFDFTKLKESILSTGNSKITKDFAFLVEQVGELQSIHQQHRQFHEQFYNCYENIIKDLPEPEESDELDDEKSVLQRDLSCCRRTILTKCEENRRLKREIQLLSQGGKYCSDREPPRATISTDQTIATLRSKLEQKRDEIAEWKKRLEDEEKKAQDATKRILLLDTELNRSKEELRESNEKYSKILKLVLDIPSPVTIAQYLSPSVISNRYKNQAPIGTPSKH